MEADNPVHYGGMAQLYLDQAQDAALKGAKQTILLHIEEARTFVRKGLSKSEDNEALLSIKHAVEQFETSTGLQ